MRFTTIFFDLDDTLYPSTSGLWNAIRERMTRFMWERLGLPKEAVSELRKHYFETYGTTLRGLQRHHGVDAEEYLAYVHDLPLAEFIHPDPEVRSLILSLPQKRWIFTNADSAHAERVLERLNLNGCFEGIIDVGILGYVCKPEPEAYTLALKIAGASDPSRCLMIDDSNSNLAGAKKAGLFTILVGAQEETPEADLSIRSLLDLRDSLPALWSSKNG